LLLGKRFLGKVAAYNDIKLITVVGFKYNHNYTDLTEKDKFGMYDKGSLTYGIEGIFLAQNLF